MEIFKHFRAPDRFRTGWSSSVERTFQNIPKIRLIFKIISKFSLKVLFRKFQILYNMHVSLNIFKLFSIIIMIHAFKNF